MILYSGQYAVGDHDCHLNRVKAHLVAVLNAQSGDYAVSQVLESTQVMVHADQYDIILSAGIEHSLSRANRVAHVVAEDALQIRIFLQPALCDGQRRFNGVIVILNVYHFDVGVFRHNILEALDSVLMAGSADCSAETCNLTLITDFLSKDFSEVYAILIIVSVAYVSDTIAAVFLRRVRAGERHNLYTLVNQLVDCRRNDLDIVYVNADYVEVSAGSLLDSAYLVCSVGLNRRIVVIVDCDAFFSILLLRVLQADIYGIPPGVNQLVSKIEVVLLLLRLIVSQL